MEQSIGQGTLPGLTKDVTSDGFSGANPHQQMTTRTRNNQEQTARKGMAQALDVPTPNVQAHLTNSRQSEERWNQRTKTRVLFANSVHQFASLRHKDASVSPLLFLIGDRLWARSKFLPVCDGAQPVRKFYQDKALGTDSKN